MQNRYVGDIGDFAKYGLLREILKGVFAGNSLGVAWYLYGDEADSPDGRFTEYLDDSTWKCADEALFDRLRVLVCEDRRREVSAIEESGLLPRAVFSSEQLIPPPGSSEDREHWRREWFERVQCDLDGCQVVFADPDNGLCCDKDFEWGACRSWKRLPLSEATALAQGRTAILYHHQSRFPGGHVEEIRHWGCKLPGCRIALRWARWSPRVFFILPESDSVHRALERDLTIFAKRWNEKCPGRPCWELFGRSRGGSFSKHNLG